MIAVPDARKGESVVALMVLKPGMAPRHIEFRAELLKSGTGKILWRELQALARASVLRTTDV